MSYLKNSYLKFLKQQEVSGSPFRDKLQQLRKYYIPI